MERQQKKKNSTENIFLRLLILNLFQQTNIAATKKQQAKKYIKKYKKYNKTKYTEHFHSKQFQFYRLFMKIYMKQIDTNQHRKKQSSEHYWIAVMRQKLRLIIVLI